MKTILLVDDQKVIRRVYTEMLVKNGYRVLAAENAVAARELLKTNPVDVLLLDIRMPDVGGTTLYDVVTQFHPQVKIIVSSVYPLEDQQRLMPEAVDYFDKSEGVDVLLDKLNVLYAH